MVDEPNIEVLLLVLHIQDMIQTQTKLMCIECNMSVKCVVMLSIKSQVVVLEQQKTDHFHRLP